MFDIDTDVPVRRALLWLAPDLASDPFTPASGGETTIAMRPAGMLVLVPEIEPDRSLGALRIRRADGLPLPVLAAAPEGRRGERRGIATVETAPLVVLGRVLGPVAEGRIELEVLLGGVVVGRIHADVRAGVNTPLAVPLSSTAAR